MTGKKVSILKISSALSQLRAIALNAKQNHPESVEWLEPAIQGAERDLQEALSALDRSTFSIRARPGEPVLVHGEIPHWVCVGCGSIVPSDKDYPDSCRCGGVDFIRDVIPARYGREGLAGNT